MQRKIHLIHSRKSSDFSFEWCKVTAFNEFIRVSLPAVRNCGKRRKGMTGRYACRPPWGSTHTTVGLKVRYFAADFVTFITKLFWNIRAEFGQPPKRFSAVGAKGEFSFKLIVFNFELALIWRLHNFFNVANYRFFISNWSFFILNRPFFISNWPFSFQIEPFPFWFEPFSFRIDPFSFQIEPFKKCW